jgi:AcrR family transcriptional regulator
MRQRARSTTDKARRAEDLVVAAEALARELGGVRHVTLAAVTERAGLHRTGARRYYSSKEELLLELAERGWGQWRDALVAEVGDRTDLDPAGTAGAISASLASLPVFCDLLTHAALHLEGEVDIERARRYKSNAFAAHDAMVTALAQAGTMAADEVADLLATAVLLAAGLWQAAHPTATLAALYEQEPRWGHVALDFFPRLDHLLKASAIGLAARPPAPRA